MQEKLMRSVTLLVSVMAMAAMAVMLKFASSKAIVIAEEVTAGTGTGQEYVQHKKESTPLLLKEDTAIFPSVRIPLPEETRPDDIVIENRYLEHRINVIIKGAEKDYYNKKEVAGDISRIQAAVSYEEEDAVVLAFRMNGLYEHKYLLEENALYLDFVNPHEMYEKIVVLDAGHGGTDEGGTVHGLKEKDFTLSVAERVRNSLEDSDVRVYCTRQEDVSVDTARRMEFINELRPDFVVSIHLNGSADAAKYGTEVWYSADYVVPVFGNPELADTLERNVVMAIDGRANGLVGCSESEEGMDPEVRQMLAGMRVPAAVLQVGYLTNEREAELLKQPEYMDKIAKGICTALESIGE